MKIRNMAIYMLLLAVALPTWGQSGAKGTEKTVEESYLQETYETMLIREQAYAENKDMKLLAIQYITEAVKDGRTSEDIRRSLEYLAMEGTITQARSGGLGRPTNNFPDVRREACLLLGNFKTEEAKDALLKVVFVDNEPMVLAAAVRSLGKIGINTNDQVTESISFIINRFDVLFPDNSLAFETIVAFENIADANGGIKDPSAIRSIMRIATGNYITPVKTKAEQLLTKLRKYAAGNK